MEKLQNIIEKAWDKRDSINTSTTGEIRGAVQQTLDALDSGILRICEKKMVLGK
jgi:2,3,4,5-tetrahydropyridine-2-carboxylate N-succinyltransferase